MSLSLRGVRLAGYNSANRNGTPLPVNLPRWRLGTASQPSSQEFDPVRSPGTSSIKKLANPGVRNVALGRQIGCNSPRKRRPLSPLNSRSWLPPVISRIDPRIPECQRHPEIDQRRIVAFRKRVLESVEPSTD
jgi:hypothetical protein